MSGNLSMPKASAIKKDLTPYQQALKSIAEIRSDKDLSGFSQVLKTLSSRKELYQLVFTPLQIGKKKR